MLWRSLSQLPKTKCVVPGKSQTVSASSMSPQWRIRSTPRSSMSLSAISTVAYRLCVSLTTAIRIESSKGIMWGRIPILPCPGRIEILPHASPRCFGLPRQHLHQRLDEEMIAPGDRLIHAQPLVIMIDAVEQDAFPLGPALGEELS